MYFFAGRNCASCLRKARVCAAITLVQGLTPQAAGCGYRLRPRSPILFSRSQRSETSQVPGSADYGCGSRPAASDPKWFSRSQRPKTSQDPGSADLGCGSRPATTAPNSCSPVANARKRAKSRALQISAADLGLRRFGPRRGPNPSLQITATGCGLRLFTPE